MLPSDARSLLKHLKYERVPAKMPDRANISKHDLTWTDEDRDPTDNAQHLQEFCDQFERKMKRLIQKSVANMDVMDSYVVEVVQHLKVKDIFFLMSDYSKS